MGVSLIVPLSRNKVIVWSKVFKHFRKAVMAGRLLHIEGRLQREGTVTHLIAAKIADYPWLLDTLGETAEGGISDLWRRG